MRRQRSLWGIIPIACFIVGVAIGTLPCCQLTRVPPPQAISKDATPSFGLLAEAWNTIERHYVDRSAVKPQTLTYGAIRGMVDALGDTGHSHFLSPEMVKQEHNFSRGTLEGIGAEIRMKNGQVAIVAPMDGTPAERAGLRPGDAILKVDEKETAGLPLDQVVDRILGPPGSTVTLTLLRPSTGRREIIPIVRARITLRSVDWERLPETQVVHLRVAAFSKGTNKDLREALIRIQHDNPIGILLDLRNNPGGLYDEAIAAASQFLKSGNVLLEKDASGKVTPVPVEPGGVATSLPTIVLINGGTSSGAEIVAGALQDAHRALLVGEKTFGTGTVLETFPLSDGSAIMLATREWLTPSGHLIWHLGIVPDEGVSLPPEVAPLIPARERKITVAELHASGDEQLLKALKWLIQSTGK